MTVNTTASKITYNGNGATTVWPFSFPAVAASDLSIYYTDTAGTATLLNPTQYSVGLNAAIPPNPTAIGGSVTYPLSGSPIAVGTFLTILRTLPDVQSTSLANQGNTYPAVVEQALDYLTMLDQQSLDLLGRAIVVAVSDPNPLPLPPVAQRALLYMAFDSAGNPIAAATNGGTSPISSAMAPVVAAATLALARTLLGLGNVAVDNVGYGLQSGVSVANQLDVNFAILAVPGSRAVVATDHMKRLVAGNTLTLNLPRANTKWNGFGFTLDTKGFFVAITVDAADNFENGNSGTAFTFPPGFVGFIQTDAANSGTWYIEAASSVVTSSNAVVNKTSSYTTTQYDNGALFLLGGNTEFTFTLPAAGSIIGPYRVSVLNTDTTKGKLIGGGASGIAPFWLYPGKNLSISLDIPGGVYRLTDPGRWRPNPGATIFVRADGSDSNSGLINNSLGAFATIPAAVAFAKHLYDNGYGPLLVSVTNGTYTIASTINLNYYLGGAENQFFITGNTASPNSVILSISPGVACFAGRDGAGTATIQGFSFTPLGNGCNAFQCTQFFQMDFGKLIFNAFPLGTVFGISDIGSMDAIDDFSFTGNFSSCIIIAGPGSKMNCGSFTVDIANNLTFTAFIEVVQGGYFNAGGAAVNFTGPGAGVGSTGIQFAITTGGIFADATTTWPGTAASGTVDATTFALRI